MEAHRVAARGTRAALWAAACVLWTLPVPRASAASGIDREGAPHGCAAPAITTEPQSVSIVEGQSATLSVTATGALPFSYRWYEGPVGDTSSPVATTPFTFATPALSAATTYWVRITNPCGHVDSAAATVTVGSRLRRHLVRPEATGLVLPYQDLSDLVEARCYGVDPWDEATGEVHGGIDLIPRHTDLAPGEMRKAALIAPAGGTIHDLRSGAKPGKATAFILTIRLNDYWFVTMVLEPQNFDPAVADEQSRSITVQAGQTVRRGDRIGDLVVTNVHYPHVHFMVYYKDPPQSFDEFLANFLLIPRNQGDNLPPTSGAGSPWVPQDLGIPTTLFCPYVYLEPASRSRLDLILKQSHDGVVCACVCAYGSKNADCGACSE